MPTHKTRLVYQRTVARKWHSSAVQRVCWYALYEVLGFIPTPDLLAQRYNQLTQFNGTRETFSGASIQRGNETVFFPPLEFFALWQAFDQLHVITGKSLLDFGQQYSATHVAGPSLPRAVEDRVQKIVDVVVDLAAPVSAAADTIRRAYNAIHRVATFIVPEATAAYDDWATAKAADAKKSIVDPLKARFNKALEVIVRESNVELAKAQAEIDKPVTLRSADEITKKLLAPIDFLKGLVNGKSK